jgi:hypothetical protein
MSSEKVGAMPRTICFGMVVSLIDPGGVLRLRYPTSNDDGQDDTDYSTSNCDKHDFSLSFSKDYIVYTCRLALRLSHRYTRPKSSDRSRSGLRSQTKEFGGKAGAK